MHNRFLSIITTFATACLLPSMSFAYVGPGAGITMLGSLWGLILAVIFIVFGLLILPIKIMRNKMKKQKEAEEAEKTEQIENPEVGP
ncbi:MAG: hypothetical protein ACR2QG_11000 [Gammaproteobacteria bacterium]